MASDKITPLLEQYTIRDGRSFRLRHIDPGDTPGVRSQDHANELLTRRLVEIQTQQEKLYAQSTWALLLIFQAMDGAGKDSTIKNVMASVNPQGCTVSSFKAPSDDERAHDFLWRTTLRLPPRGHIAVFNRSYYEEVLIVRVHPALLEPQRLPAAVTSRRLWKERFDDINAFERHLVRSGTVVRKFFLHVSKGEQRKRMFERLERPDKHWKFSIGDLEERQHWRRYMAAYEDMVRNTATAAAPWCVVPADHKWFARLVVATEVESALRSMGLSYPKVDATRRAELARGRAMLGVDGGAHRRSL